MQRFASRKIPRSCEVLREKKQLCSVIFMSTGLSQETVWCRGMDWAQNWTREIQYLHTVLSEKITAICLQTLYFILTSYKKTNVDYVVWLYWLCRGTKHCPCEAILKMYMYYPLPSHRGECYLRTPNRDCRKTHEHV